MTAESPLVARHGDSWVSPRWAIVIGGEPVDPALWVIRAQARRSKSANIADFDWSVAAGTVRLGSAVVQLADGSQLTTGTVQLALRPQDWTDKPNSYFGYVDVEIASDHTTNPAYRYTVVSARSFRVLTDVTR